MSKLWFINQQRTLGGASTEISATCAAITPTLGDELVTNGGFDSDVASWTTVNCNLASTAGGQSGNYCQLTSTGDYGSMDQCSMYEKNGNSRPWIRLGSTRFGIDYLNSTAMNNANWAQLLTTFRSVSTLLSIYAFSIHTDAGNVFGMDTITAKEITGTDVLVGDRLVIAGTYQCKPTVVIHTQCGFKICYADSSNYILAVVDRLYSDNVRLYKCIAGTFSAVANCSGTITYVAEQVLGVVVAADGTVKLYYNGVQIGTDGSVALATMGKKVYGFSTYASNTVGLVTTNP